MPSALLVHHAPSPRLRGLLEALTEGLAHPELEGLDSEVVPALGATADHVLRSDGFVFLTPANFGYMSGALKHFFDTTYYTCLDAVAGRPYALCVHGDDDTAGAVRSVERIAGGMGLEKVAEPLSVTGDPGLRDGERALELAATVGATLLA